MLLRGRKESKKIEKDNKIKGVVDNENTDDVKLLDEIRYNNKSHTEKVISNSNLRDTATNSVLSPHNSVFEALQNPDLNRGVDLSNIKTHIFNDNNNNNISVNSPNTSTSQFQFQFQFQNQNQNQNQNIDNYNYRNYNFNYNDHNNMDFSQTSWQNISTYFEINNETRSNSQSSNNNFPFNLPSSNNSNIISSGHNSPYLKNDDVFNNFMPNRIDSPNVASILSSSSGQDENNSNNEINESQQTKIGKNLNFQTNSPDSESGIESDTEEDHTIDSSTILSSFVMPRVSIMSNSINSQNQSISNDRFFINVKIIGDRENCLIKRFKSYKKTFKNIEFSIDKNSFTDLIILIVNNDNYMLPKFLKIPCIPICLSKNQLILAKQIPKYLKICDPIELNSLNDNLIILINFLSNINNLKDWKLFLSNLTIEDNKQNNINNINSSLIEFLSNENENKILNSSSIFSNVSFTKTLKQNNKNNFSNEKNNNNFFKVSLITSVAVGVISLGLVFIWKKLTTKELIQNSTSKHLQELSYNTLNVNESNLVFDQYIFVKLKSITTKIESLGEVVFSGGIMVFQKVKLVLIELLNF